MIFSLAVAVILSQRTEGTIAERLIRVGPTTMWVVSSAKAVHEISSDGQMGKTFKMPSDPYVEDVSGEIGLWVSSKSFSTFRDGKYQDVKVGENVAKLIRSSLKDMLSGFTVSLKSDTCCRRTIINQEGQDSKFQTDVFRLSTGEKIYCVKEQCSVLGDGLLELPRELFPSAKTDRYRLVLFSNPSRPIDLSQLNDKMVALDNHIRKGKLWFSAVGDTGQKSQVGVVDVTKGAVKTWSIGDQLMRVMGVEWFADDDGASVAYLPVTLVGQRVKLKFLTVSEKGVADGPTVKLDKLAVSSKHGVVMSSFDDGTVLVAGQEGFYVVKGRGASSTFHGWK